MGIQNSYFYITCYLLASAVCTSEGNAPSSKKGDAPDLTEKVEMRRILDEMTLELEMNDDSNSELHHSYVFNSGTGNREEIHVEMMSKEAGRSLEGEGVLGWVGLESSGLTYLLGRKPRSVTLVVGAVSNTRSSSRAFSQESFDVGAEVSATALFSRWDPTLHKKQVLAVVAVNNPSDDLLWFSVTDNKLVKRHAWARCKQTRAMTVVNTGGEDQLVTVDSGSPAVINVFTIVFGSKENSMEFRLVHSFSVEEECDAVTVSRVGSQLFLMLPQRHSLLVYRQQHSPHFLLHTSLALSRVSQVLSLTMAGETYVAVNGEQANVFKLTMAGDFIPQLDDEGDITDWLAIPVSTFRGDVLLLSRSANLTTTRLHVWAGSNLGFKVVPVPQCDKCLEGKWAGAVSVAYPDQTNVVLLPDNSQLLMVATSLRELDNPFLSQLTTIEQLITHEEEKWEEFESKVAQVEEGLRNRLDPHKQNTITAKWKLGKLWADSLQLNSLLQPKSEMVVSDPVKTPTMDVGSLKHTVDNALQTAADLLSAVESQQQQTWGLQGFRGKVTFKGGLTVDNLTLANINNYPVDKMLTESFRSDKPQPIEGNVVVESLKAENVIINNKIKNYTIDKLKFKDGPINITEDVTFLNPVSVKGDVEIRSGLINNKNLSQELCQGEDCLVLPKYDIDLRGDFDNTVKAMDINRTWKKVFGGRNLTVMRLNGKDWNTVVSSAVYKNKYQHITSPVTVTGTLSSSQIWNARDEEIFEGKKRKPELKSENLRSPNPRSRPAAGNKNHDDVEKWSEIDPLSDSVFTELVVMGTVTSKDSEWGRAARDVVLTETSPIKIQADKQFTNNTTVDGNLQVKGLVAGINVSELITENNHQVLKELAAETVLVSETLNGVPVSDLVYTATDEITYVKQLSANSLEVTEDINVHGKLCDWQLDEFNSNRLSIKEEQNITKKLVIDKATIEELSVDSLNYVEVSSLQSLLGQLNKSKTLRLSALHVDGDIDTALGVNGYNVTSVAEHAVWLRQNNEVEGRMLFKNPINVSSLCCQGLFNQGTCGDLSDEGVIYTTDETVYISGKKRFLNLVSITENLLIDEINHSEWKNVLTRTTEQTILGDMHVNGDVSFKEESVLMGLLNSQNISEFGNRCSLSQNTIRCRGSTVFNDSLTLDHFNVTGNINGQHLHDFLDSLINVQNPKVVEDFKDFTGKVTVINNMKVETINNEHWEKFLSDAVTVTRHGYEEVMVPLEFKDSVSAHKVTVDYELDTPSVNGVDLREWQLNAIYINESFRLERSLHLNSVSSEGNISVTQYEDVCLDSDVIPLHTASEVRQHLRFQTITVTGHVDINGPVNGHSLTLLEQNTLKVLGNQTIASDISCLNNVTVSGSLEVTGPANNQDLHHVVTLHSDQTLHGKYDMECVVADGDVSAHGLVSGVNTTGWQQSAVLRRGEEPRVVTGQWQVEGDLVLGTVRGPGLLAHTDLAQLSHNLTRDVTTVHHHMKMNLSSTCEETNSRLRQARAQTSTLLYLDHTQSLAVPTGVTALKHFTDGDENYLAVCEKNCNVTIYKWDTLKGLFYSFYKGSLGQEIKQVAVLHHNQLTYLLTVSFESSEECTFSGSHLWLLAEENLEHVSAVNLRADEVIQASDGSLYSKNSSGVFQWSLQVSDKTVSFNNSKKWTYNTGLPLVLEVVSLGHPHLLPPDMICSGQVTSLAADPSLTFLAVAVTEAAQVPRFSDHVKVYRHNGSLFDKLRAHRASHLQWLPVPDQTWLVFLQNLSSIQLYHLEGVIRGFQLKLSAEIKSQGLSSFSLPLTSKVNPQPFLISKTSTSVDILRAFIEGDPYLGPQLTCSFDDDLHTVIDHV